MNYLNILLSAPKLSNVQNVKEIRLSINFLNTLNSSTNYYTINLIGPNGKIYNVCNNVNFKNTNQDTNKRQKKTNKQIKRKPPHYTIGK